MISRLILSLLAALLLFAPEALAAKREVPTGAKPNKLINEASPYLRQHAYNPVNWYPWGEEAFEKAKRENKPVLLSVGYSTCHWCHVMERESYSDKDIAEILNLNFVAIKVDRERRPDVDETYMLATQLITRSGGWPNNVFLTPQRKPFHGGTYIPPGDFKTLLIEIARLWEQDHKVLLGDAERVASAIDTVMTRRIDALALTPAALATATSEILKSLDEFNGGFGDQLKFPQESVLLYLLWRAEKDGDKAALDAVTLTLDHMLNGGIHDHAGGGFHRYAVDPQWLVPHFEKMLYNQALITQVLLGAYRQTGNERYARAVRRTLDYVLDDMTAPEGGFYSARDADSEGEEGTFYVWRPEQLKEALGEEDGELAAKIFGVDLLGNFERQTTVLHFPKAPEEIAADLKLDLPAFNARVDALRKRIAKARQEREAPHRDEKIVTAWNGMMVTAFAEAADVLGVPAYRAAAEKAGKFLWETLHIDGDLRRTWFEGEVSLEGQQEDYAYMGLAFVSLYDLTGDQTWLDRAESLTEEMVKRFRDEEVGDYYMTASVNTFARMKARTDAGTPSGNAAALALFARLSRRSLKPEHKINGEALLAALSGIAIRAPASSAYSLSSGDLLLRGGAGAQQFLAKGRVNARAAIDKASGKLKVMLDIAPGWHINSDKPLEEFFIPTELSVAGAPSESIAYPEPIRRKLGFHDKELALYEGKAALTAPMPEKTDGPVKATLKLQACSDEICLEPETAVLTLRE